jgi:hypothetical protein
MIETGVILGMQDNASATARKIAGELDNVTKSADGINSAFDPKYLDDYNKKLAEIGQSYSKLNAQKSSQHQNTLRQAQTMMTGASSGVMQASKGNVAGGAMTAGKAGLAGLASSLGVGGALAGSALVAGGFIGNSLADMYEKRADPARGIAASMDMMTTDVTQNTEALRSVMAQTVKSVSKYGKSYEEGARAIQTFTTAGGTDFDASRAGAYSMAYNADFGALSAFGGRTQRFGQERGLNDTWASMRGQGLGPAQFEEVMGTVQSTFESALSRGVLRSTEDIAKEQVKFGKLGETWQGALGSQRLDRMGASAANAANVQSEDDMLMYRAAFKQAGGDPVKTQLLLEGGMTGKLFSGFMEETIQYGYDSDYELMKAVQKGVGVSGTEAMNLINGWKKGDLGDLTDKELARFGSGISEGSGATTGTQYTAVMESFMQFFQGGMGSKFFDDRSKLMGGAIGIFKNMIDMSGAVEDTLGFGEDPQGLDEFKNYAAVKGGKLSLGGGNYRKVSEMIKRLEEEGMSGEDIWGSSFGKGIRTGIGQGQGFKSLGAMITGEEISVIQKAFVEISEKLDGVITAAGQDSNLISGNAQSDITELDENMEKIR